MKKVILSAVMITVIGLTSCKNEIKPKEKETTEATTKVATTDVSFGVRGNCGMCKTTIEEAVTKLEGITTATWDKDKKKIAVSFDDTKTDVLAIHTAIAASGYDTEKMMGSEEAYENLPGCCKYDHSMDMNIE